MVAQPRIPKKAINALRASLDIVELAGRFLPLAQRGDHNFFACCPFHDEQTPSFTVSADKQMFYCFGCSASGDALEFFMRIKDIGFVEAASRLAFAAGLPPLPNGLPVDSSGIPDGSLTAGPTTRRVSGRVTTTAVATIASVLSEAAEHYRQALRMDSTAIAYLKSRGVSGRAAHTFALGASARKSLKTALSRYEQQALLDAGVLQVAHATGRIFEPMRGRVVFPISNQQGVVVGLAGRDISGRSRAKYINTHESPLFRKREHLFGVDAATIADRQAPVLVVEGYFDVIALHQAGYPATVGTMGTALTDPQARKIFGWQTSHRCGPVIYCFDGDEAGRRAAARATQVSLPYLRDASHMAIAMLPSGHDPASLLERSDGIDSINTCIAEALPVTEYIARTMLDKFNWQTPSERLAMSDALRTCIAAARSQTLRVQLQDAAEHIWGMNPLTGETKPEHRLSVDDGMRP